MFKSKLNLSSVFEKSALDMAGIVPFLDDAALMAIRAMQGRSIGSYELKKEIERLVEPSTTDDATIDPIPQPETIPAPTPPQEPDPREGKYAAEEPEKKKRHQTNWKDYFNVKEEIGKKVFPPSIAALALMAIANEPSQFEDLPKSKQKMVNKLLDKFDKQKIVEPEVNLTFAPEKGDSDLLKFLKKVLPQDHYNPATHEVHTGGDPYVMSHEIGHALDFGGDLKAKLPEKELQKIMKSNSRRTMLTRGIVPSAAMLGSYLLSSHAPEGYEDAADYAPAVAAAGFAPMLRQEAAATYHALANAHRTGGFPSLMAGAARLVPALATYAAAPIGTYLALKEMIGDLPKFRKDQHFFTNIDLTPQEKKAEGIDDFQGANVTPKDAPSLRQGTDSAAKDYKKQQIGRTPPEKSAAIIVPEGISAAEIMADLKAAYDKPLEDAQADYDDAKRKAYIGHGVSLAGATPFLERMIANHITGHRPITPWWTLPIGMLAMAGGTGYATTKWVDAALANNRINNLKAREKPMIEFVPYSDDMEELGDFKEASMKSLAEMTKLGPGKKMPRLGDLFRRTKLPIREMNQKHAGLFGNIKRFMQNLPGTISDEAREFYEQIKTHKNHPVTQLAMGFPNAVTKDLEDLKAGDYNNSYMRDKMMRGQGPEASKASDAAFDYLLDRDMAPKLKPEIPASSLKGVSATPSRPLLSIKTGGDRSDLSSIEPHFSQHHKRYGTASPQIKSSGSPDSRMHLSTNRTVPRTELENNPIIGGVNG